MITLREISLNNGKTLRNMKFFGGKDDFEKQRKTEFEIELYRESLFRREQVCLTTDSIIYYIFAKSTDTT